MLSWGIGGVFRRFSIKECDKIKVSKAKNYCRLPSAPLLRNLRNVVFSRVLGNLENVKQVILDRKRPYWNNKIVVKIVVRKISNVRLFCWSKISKTKPVKPFTEGTRRVGLYRLVTYLRCILHICF